MDRYAKAITAALVAGLGAIGTALTPDANGASTLTAQEWVAAAIVFLTGLGLVWAVPNQQP
jgi:hypothetical protein